MDDKQKITVLYDAAEDTEKAKAEAEGKPFPLAYAQVADALEKRGHKVKTVAVSKKISSLVSLIEKDESDVIFNLCESIASTSKHEHNVVGLLELFEKCFTGSGSIANVLAGDKALCKKIFQFHGIRYPRFCTYDNGEVDWADDLEFPLIIKPINEAASIGIDKGSVVHNVKELLERISYINREFGGAALVEEFIEGREIYVGVLGNDRPIALPILEWDFSKVKDGPRIAGAEAKWDPDSEGFKAPEVFPQDLPEEVDAAIKRAAVAAYEALKLTGYARVDMRLRRRGGSGEGAGAEAAPSKAKDEPAEKAGAKGVEAAPAAPKKHDTRSRKAALIVEGWDFPILEVNPNCWLEKRSEFAMAARKHGLSYPDLLERIVELALERRPRAQPG